MSRGRRPPPIQLDQSDLPSGQWVTEMSLPGPLMSDLDARKSQTLATTGKAISIDGEEHLTQGWGQTVLQRSPSLQINRNSTKSINIPGRRLPRELNKLIHTKESPDKQSETLRQEPL